MMIIVTIPFLMRIIAWIITIKWLLPHEEWMTATSKNICTDVRLDKDETEDLEIRGSGNKNLNERAVN